ncbi:MAG: polysaccharide deacetylase family protein [Fibrobacter sp.]|nr:polysaccharide deacetylase family protein [Fibrobacter sp.]
MDYKKLTVAAALMGASMIYAQDAEIATWSGFRKGAASFTFDDGAPSHVSDGAPLFDKYGYKGTFNLVVNWNPNWSGFQSMADNGHEIASHSNSHGQNMSGEEASSKNNIKSHINQKYGIITVAYPNCNVPNESAVLQNYIVGRICNGSWQQISDDMGKDGPSNWAKVPANMTGTEGQVKSTNDFTSRMQSVVSKNGWVAFLTHGFEGKSNGSAMYSPTDLSAIEGALKWAQQNDKDIWVAPMGHVAMYIKERKAAQVSASTSGSTTTVKLTHNIKQEGVSDYDYPLTLKVKTSLSKAEVTQAGAKLEAKIEGGYAIFDAVPNAGDITIAGEGAGPSSSSSEASSSSAAPDQSSSSGTPQAIAEIQADFHISVYRSSDNYIVVGGAQGMDITVFNSLGHQVRTTRGLGAVQKVYTGAKGVYVVKVGSKSYKVKL